MWFWCLFLFTEKISKSFCFDCLFRLLVLIVCFDHSFRSLVSVYRKFIQVKLFRLFVSIARSFRSFVSIVGFNSCFAFGWYFLLTESIVTILMSIHHSVNRIVSIARSFRSFVSIVGLFSKPLLTLYFYFICSQIQYNHLTRLTFSSIRYFVNEITRSRFELWLFFSDLKSIFSTKLTELQSVK